MKIKLFSYNQLDTFVHKLSGLTKLVCFLLLTTTVMLTYDIRIILAILIFSYFLMNKAQIKFKQVKTMFIYVGIFLITNFILTFLFSPTYGCEIYGTKHVLFPIFGRYEVTLEQLFYQCTKFLKYLSVIPLGMIFFLTTNPSEFASSLNHIKVNYKVCTSLSLTLRYFPDVQRDYHTISLAQQARGLEMSSKAKLINRIKNVVTILTPLIFTTMDRIELITNAMELRGFGKGKKRSWYSFKPLQTKDWISMFICLLIFLFMLYIRIFVNKSMFYNPFI
ncbi:MAG: energy-coupling factor transporter transmembrane component T family protein [Floccifex porci]|uniref:Energy-coupling factor transporter transmembrane protein EcfT n=2 Tax=Floccifex porci TaxID=2606629 RepID=A0A7X2N2E2_9FIRM|nr:energy-coupling factor transporter transmembrane component T [Floccifex porci]MDO4480499.1 energy-coupling factor transporter transmembrane component T [Erysipelotrichaceae bacterium]MSS01186.1 energy-coupling factor transporter transmembrane protein EcfT [Floccifex porci]